MQNITLFVLDSPSAYPGKTLIQMTLHPVLSRIFDPDPGELKFICHAPEYIVWLFFRLGLRAGLITLALNLPTLAALGYFLAKGDLAWTSTVPMKIFVVTSITLIFLNALMDPYQIDQILANLCVNA